MKNKILVSLFIIIAHFNPTAAYAETLLGQGSKEPHILVNNRILVQVNGKAISVMDIMKKMDLLFFKQYPQYSSSVVARHQFYQAYWKKALNEIIDKELILIDSEELKIKINPGDVRQEMETLFGPNIIINLDKAGLTFDEAYQMVHDDIAIRRMLYFRVHTNVIAEVTPQKVRDYYEAHAKDNIRDNEWTFQVITIRHRNPAKGAETANLVHHLLVDERIPLDHLSQKLQEMKIDEPTQKTIAISELFINKEKELSDLFKKTLTTLDNDAYSTPIAQKSKADNSTVFRIFYLKKMTPGGIVPYQELESQIKNKLLDEGAAVGTDKYFREQREHFDIQDKQLEEIFSSDFQPFILITN